MSGVYDVFAQKTLTIEGVSLAVAPFEVSADEVKLDSGSRSSKEFLGIGLADALTTKLSRVRRITVRPTSSVVRLAATLDANALGKALNVDFVLTGRILRVDKRLRITVQLLNVGDNSILWAQSFDESATDIFSLQDSISERVAASLVPQLTAEEKETLHRHATQNAEAYELYLRGRAFFHNYTFGGISAAENCFEQAIEHDPILRSLIAALADFYNLQTVFGLDFQQERVSRARKNPRAAPRARSAVSRSATRRWRLRPGLRLGFCRSRKTVSKSHPAQSEISARARMVRVSLEPQRKTRRSPDEMRVAERFDPILRRLLRCSRSFFIMRAVTRKVWRKRGAPSTLDPDYYIALQSLGWICPPLGKFDEGIEGCRRAVRICDQQAISKFSLALALIDAGQTKEARALAAELEDRRHKEQVPAYYPALVYAISAKTKQRLNGSTRRSKSAAITRCGCASNRASTVCAATRGLSSV